MIGTAGEAALEPHLAPESAQPAFDTAFSPAEYAEMLSEVKGYLPAFLSPAASEQHDPVGDVKDLLRLDQRDLDRVIAVHICLSDEVSDFVTALDQGLRRPLTSTERPEEATQAVRGPIDWGATVRHRSIVGWNRSVFVVRPNQRIFETPENQSLLWVITRLEVAIARAARSLDEAESDEAAGWLERLGGVSKALRRARRVEWIRDLRPVRPTPRVQQRIAAARLSFYREKLGRVVQLLLDTVAPDEHALTQILCQRYFQPSREWRLFEVLVALRIARCLADSPSTKTIRRPRLLQGGEGVEAFARYDLTDGTQVQIVAQGWPRSKPPSVRSAVAAEHAFAVQPSIPDLFVVRRDASGAVLDAVVIEVKASKARGYLGQGLFELLGYIGEQPALLARSPAGWLVAPPSTAFQPAAGLKDRPLWVLSADDLGTAVVDRFRAD